jgi:hypothetical protein
LVLVDTQRGHHTVSRVQPVIGNKTGDVFKEKCPRRIVGTTSRGGEADATGQKREIENKKNGVGERRPMRARREQRMRAVSVAATSTKTSTRTGYTEWICWTHEGALDAQNRTSGSTSEAAQRIRLAV